MPPNAPVTMVSPGLDRMGDSNDGRSTSTSSLNFPASLSEAAETAAATISTRWRYSLGAVSASAWAMASTASTWDASIRRAVRDFAAVPSLPSPRMACCTTERRSFQGWASWHCLGDTFFIDRSVDSTMRCRGCVVASLASDPTHVRARSDAPRDLIVMVCGLD